MGRRAACIQLDEEGTHRNAVDVNPNWVSMKLQQLKHRNADQNKGGILWLRPTGGQLGGVFLMDLIRLCVEHTKECEGPDGMPPFMILVDEATCSVLNSLLRALMPVKPQPTVSMAAIDRMLALMAVNAF